MEAIPGLKNETLRQAQGRLWGTRRTPVIPTCKLVIPTAAYICHPDRSSFAAANERSGGICVFCPVIRILPVAGGLYAGGGERPRHHLHGDGFDR